MHGNYLIPNKIETEESIEESELEAEYWRGVRDHAKMEGGK